MEKSLAIRIKGLSKEYIISEKKIGISISDRIKELFLSYKKNKNQNKEDFYALKDINLEIKKGESVGIIGRNGAGKSTLLKILSEVVEATEGTIEVNGTIASVLEVGMGFHPELTGRENVYLSGAMLGLSKKQIARQFDEIVSFSGVEKFIDQPVKHYSSGMYVRLAFSVVANIDADILLFDEVLNVGDISFQIKCAEKINQLTQQKKTIVLVSHNLSDIIRLCNRIVYLENGLVKSDSTKNTLAEYIDDSLKNSSLFDVKNNSNILNTLEKRIIEWDNLETAPGNEDIKLKKIYINVLNKKNDDNIFTSDEIEIGVEYYKQKNEDFFGIGFTISYLNSYIIGAYSLFSNANLEKQTDEGYYSAKTKIPSNFFNETNVQVGVSFTKNLKEIIFSNLNLLNLKIKRPLTVGAEVKVHYDNMPIFPGPILPHWEWEIKKNG